MSCLPKHVRLVSIQPIFQNGIDETIIIFKLVNCSQKQRAKITNMFSCVKNLDQSLKDEILTISEINEIEKNLEKIKTDSDLVNLQNEIKLILDIGKNSELKIWKFQDKQLDLNQPRIMGILNVTPDSFSDGGNYLDKEMAVEHALQIVEEGADIIDIGGESTRPGAQPISVQEEINRVLPIIQSIKKQVDVPISIDTYKSEIAEVAVQEGASIINDISGAMFDHNVLNIAKKYQTGLILMHIKGTPKSMQQNPNYANLIEEILTNLANCVDQALKIGINPDQILIDPGIGFGKRWFDNYDIINRLNEFRILNLPILLGISRKSFLGKFLSTEPKLRLEGSLIANTLAFNNGANILRVHDVKETKKALKIADLFQKREWGIEPNIVEELFHA